MTVLTFTRCRGSSGGVKQKGAGCWTNGCGRRCVVAFLPVSPLRGYGGEGVEATIRVGGCLSVVEWEWSGDRVRG
jgi:hypothetical protein